MKIKCCGAVFLLGVAALFSGELKYNLNYQISGSAVSRLLFIIPLRVYYDASVSINLSAFVQPDGKTNFVFEEIPQSAYVMRTLGFSGKTLAMLTADYDYDRCLVFSDQWLSQWRKEDPEYAERIKTVKRFPHLLIFNGQVPLAFERDRDGTYQNFFSNIETRYRFYPAQTGIYFNVFHMLPELLNMCNQRFTPGQDISYSREFPTAWTGEDIDLSPNINRLASLLEKVVKSLVTVQQVFPFRLNYCVTENGPDEVEICAESFPDVPIWKDFMIREFLRRVRVRLADEVLIFDEIWLGIRNRKGQGGFGRMQLKLVN